MRKTKEGHVFRPQLALVKVKQLVAPEVALQQVLTKEEAAQLADSYRQVRGLPIPVRKLDDGTYQVIGRNNDVATLDESPNSCRAGDCNAVHQHTRHQPCTCLVKSAMNNASALATQIPEISQNRMITVVSGQPTSSK